MKSRLGRSHRLTLPFFMLLATLWAAPALAALDNPASTQDPVPAADTSNQGDGDDQNGDDQNGDDQNGDDKQSDQQGTQETIDELVQAVRDKLPAQFDGGKVSRSTVCKFVGAGDAGWVASCTPPEIEVSAETASAVFIELPKTLADEKPRVTVTAGENWGENPGLNSDEIDLEKCGRRQQISLALYKFRRFAPPYSSQMFIGAKEAAKALDGNACPDVLSLLVSGEREWVRITVHTADRTYTADVRLLYLRWLVDVGGFYALRWTGDQDVVTRVHNGMDGEDPQTEILRIDDPDQTSDAGVMMNFFRRNYPSFGVGFGLAFPEQRSPSYYLGLSWRLLNRDTAAVATFTVGALYSEVKTFPGIVAGEMYDSNDPRLAGSIDYDESFFAAVTLGFELPNRPK